MNPWDWFVGFLERVLFEFSVNTGSAGIGIIIFTVCARLVILPLTLSSIRSSRRMQEIQPVIKELQRKYGKDQRQLQEEMLKIYREYKINPAGSCLPLLLQLPIFIGVYQAVSHLMIPDWRIHLKSQYVADAIITPGIAALFERPFLGLDLGRATWGPAPLGFNGFEYLILPLLSIVLQFVQQIMATPRIQDPQQKAMMQAMLVMPLIFGYIAFTFPAGAVLYWVTSSLIGVVQQYFTSGWGSLVNYLKFLPPDNRPMPSLALATTGTGGGVAAVTGKDATGSDSAADARQSFWDVLRPLTELDAKVAQTEQASPESPIEKAIDEARRQGRPQNPRRPRRRR